MLESYLRFSFKYAGVLHPGAESYTLNALEEGGGNVDVFTHVALLFLLCCRSGSGVRHDCGAAQTQAAVKAPVIGCRLHRDQQMEGR